MESFKSNTAPGDGFASCGVDLDTSEKKEALESDGE